MPDPAQQFAQAIQGVQESLIKQMLNFRKQGASREEILLILQSLDMQDVILTQLGLSSDVDKLILEYERVLRGLEMTGTVTNETLTALLEMDRATFYQQAGLMGENIRKELSKGVIAGLSEAEITEGILAGSGGVLRVDQAETLANTALNTFERNVTAEMATFDPPDATYVYLGVVDERTRDICLEMVGAGALTRDEIDSQFPGAFIDGGGFNCRHRWSKETKTSEKLTETKKAVSVISAKKKQGKWRSPQTFRDKIG